MAKPLGLTDATFDQEVLQAEIPVLVDFWSPTCPHCRQLNPQYEAAAELQEGTVKFAKLAVPDGRQAFVQHAVMVVPTLVLFRDGEEIARSQGAMKADEIGSWLEDNL